MERKHSTQSIRIMQLAAKFSVMLALLINISSCNKPDFSTKQQVGEIAAKTYMTPVNQILTPTGIQVELPNMRPQVLALSPDGRLLATSGKTQELVMIDPMTGEI